VLIDAPVAASAADRAHLGGLTLAGHQKSPSRDGMAVNKQVSLSRLFLSVRTMPRARVEPQDVYIRHKVTDGS
jgi:hypothetical protein